MKICFDARVILNEKTGIGNYSSNLINSLLKIDSNNEYILYLNNSLTREHQCFKIKAKNLEKKIIPIKPVSVEQQIKIKKYLKKERPDIYHYPNWDVPLFQKAKTIFTVHDLTYLRNDTFYVNFPLLKKVYTFLNIYLGLKKAQKIIAVSNNTRNDIKKIFKFVNDEKIEVVYEACEENFYKKLSIQEIKGVLSTFGIRDKYFLFIGERRPHKNLPRIIEAFNEFLKSHPGYKFLIIGKAYANYKGDLNKIKSLKLENHVLVLNYIKDDFLPAFYQGAEALVFTSLYEGFGIPVLEAMASQIPVITSDNSSMREIAGDAAIKINPYNAKEIYKAMRNIVENDSLSKKLVEKAKNRIKLFSWDIAAEKTLKIYEEIGRKK